MAYRSHSKKNTTMNYKVLLNRINHFIFDVDGVFTDGSVSIYKEELVRTFNARDCYAIQYAVKLGYTVSIVTGGDSEPVKATFNALGVHDVHLKSHDKLKVFEQFLAPNGIEPERALYMGDDIPDIPLLKTVLLPCCPLDASVDVKSNCQYVSPFVGGKGCVRDVIEQTLRCQGKWLLEEAFQW